MFKKKIDPSIKINYYLNLYDSINDQIKFSDTKASFLFAAVTFFFGLLINYINNNQVFYNPHFYFLFVGIGCLIFSLLFLFISVFPRVNYHKRSTIFWGSIRLHERSEFVEKVKTYKDIELLSDLCEQIHILSHITSNKMEHIQYAMIFMAIAFLFILFYFIFNIPI